MFLPTFAWTGGNYITLTASVSDTFGKPPSPVECSLVCFGICNTCVKLMKVVCLKMVACRVNMCYSTSEDVELVLNEGLDLEDFSDSVSEENIVDSGEEFVPVNFEADLSNSDNNIFIFVTGIHATSRIKLFFFLLCLDSSHFAVVTEKGMWYDYGLFTWQAHILSFLKMYVHCIIPRSLFTTVFFLNGHKQCVYRCQEHHFVASWVS